MLLIPLIPGERAGPPHFTLQGMRACGTATVTFDGLPAPPAAHIGQPGDYLRQPEFSAGAWRTAAVTLGGLDALATELRTQLSQRHRDAAPHQRARIGAALMAQETAALWLHKAATIAESRTHPAGDVAAYVNLARLAVESATLDTIRIAQRALGLAALLATNPVERLLRDLTTYLRQPAPDETLDEAAAWFTTRPLPTTLESTS